jgi:hypothetical protein
MKNRRIVLVVVGVVCFLAGSMIPSMRSAPPASESMPLKYHIVNCMKLKSGDFGKAMENEKEWKRIEQYYIAQGMKRSWAVYGYQFSGTEDRCDYVTVDSFENWSDLENPYPDFPNVFKKIYPDKNFDEFLKQTGDSHEVAHRDAMVLIDHAE